MRALDRGKIACAGRIEEAVDNPLAVIGRQIDRQALPAECLLYRGEHAWQVDVLGIDAIDDDQPAKTALRGPLHHPRRDHLDARARVDDDGCRLNRVERADRLTDEIGKSRRIDQMNPRATRLEV